MLDMYESVADRSVCKKSDGHRRILERRSNTGCSQDSESAPPHFCCNRRILRELFSSLIVDISIMDGFCAIYSVPIT